MHPRHNPKGKGEENKMEQNKSIRVEQSEFPSKDDRHTISYALYTPACNPFAILQIVHGMGEDKSRYDEAARFFASQGLVVCVHDQLGHGGSAKDRNDLGFFGEDNGLECLLGDIDSLRMLMRKKYRFLPYVMFGHSLGSLLLRRYITEHGQDIDGCILCGTMGRQPAVGKALTAAKLLALFKGKRHRSLKLELAAFGHNNDAFPKEEGVFAWLTKDEAIRKDKEALSVGAEPFTVSAYRDLFTLIREVNAEDWASEVPQSLPILLISGKDDPIGRRGEGVKEVYAMLEDAEINVLDMKLYENDRHNLFDETDRETVYSDVLTFVQRVAEGVVECRRNGI